LAVALILAALAGRPMLQWSIETLRRVPEIERIVVALPAGAPAPAGTVGVPGGKVRSESVRLALDAAGTGDPVLVHDAARPLLSVELAQSVLAALAGDGVDAAIAASAVTDTVKRADGDGTVVQTLDRSDLWAVQTPQVFRRAALERALDVPAEVLAAATDDASLVERLGGRVVIVPAPRENLKVTTPLDLAVAEMLIASRRA
jgi:2-C-methyl-D-erythritol 4-phosphate cytidylyltransferase